MKRSRFTEEQIAMALLQAEAGTPMAMDHWAYWNQIGLSFSRPGKPGDNARNEAFNGLVRRECLTHHYFLDLREAVRVLNSWKEEYNNVRPHGSLGQLPPAHYRAYWSKKNDPERLANCG